MDLQHNFFFLLIKTSILIKKKEPRNQEVHKGYTKGNQKGNKKQQNRLLKKPTSQETYQPKNQWPGRQKTSLAPQLEANSSKKPISEEISSPMYKLFQLHKLETNECFSFCTSIVPSLNAMRLRSFHTVQKMKKGNKFPNLSSFFSNKRILPTDESILENFWEDPRETD